MSEEEERKEAHIAKVESFLKMQAAPST